jgi:ABC-type sugar transport system ATPase subunit
MPNTKAMNLDQGKPADVRQIPLLSLRDVTKSFFGVTVLHGVSFDLQPGEVLGLVGQNGSGKSTTMNILGGVHQRDSGEIVLNGAHYRPRVPRDAEDAGIAFIQQELNIFANLSVEENLLMGRFPRRARWLPVISFGRLRERAQELLAAVDLNVSPHASASTLSPGERQLVEIAKALSLNAQIIIFDEPTTSLTSRESERLFALIERLRQQRIGIIYISHLLADVMRLSDQIVVLRDGDVVRRGPKLSMTIDDLVTAMVGRSIEALFPNRSRRGATGPTVLEVERVSQPGIVRNVSFSVAEGEIVGIAGMMGSGRTELARILFGLDPFESGRIFVTGRPFDKLEPRACIARGMAFLTEDRRHEGLMMDGSVAANLELAALPQHARGISKRIEDRRLGQRMSAIKEQLDIKTRDLWVTPVRTLSGGNQQKVVIGKWLLRQPKLFILDEPTRGLDVGAKEEVNKAIVQLADAGTAVLMISSELEELMGMCDRVLVMNRGELGGTIERSAFEREAILKAAIWKGIGI